MKLKMKQICILALIVLLLASNITFIGLYAQKKEPETPPVISGNPAPTLFHKVSFKTDTDAPPIQSLKVSAGGLATRPKTPSAKNGLVFMGWYKDLGYSQKWNFSVDPVTSDITLYAHFAAPTTNDFFTFELTQDELGYSVGISADIYDYEKIPREIIIPDFYNDLPVTELTEGGFSSGLDSIRSIRLPETVRKIADYAFASLRNLKDINLENIEEIGDGAFIQCENLQNLDLSQVKTIRESVFNNCRSLKFIYLPVCESLGAYNFMYSYSLKTFIADSLTVLYDYMFNQCLNLSYVSAKNVKTLGNGTFTSCYSLEKVDLPTLETIGNSTFTECHSLNEISLPSLKRLPEMTFYNCFNLKSVSIPAVETIENYAFERCINLKTLSYGPNLQSIEMSGLKQTDWYFSLPVNELLFMNNILIGIRGESDTVELVVPDHIKKIAGEAFHGQKNISSIDFNMTEKIGNNSFSGMAMLEKIDMKNIRELGQYAFYNNMNLKEVIFSPLESVSESSFSHCTSLEEVTLPESVKHIDGMAFYGCNSLKTVSLNQAQTIAASAFAYCSGLEEIILPASIMSVESFAFGSCFNLKKVIVNSADPFIIHQDAFKYSANVKIYVPAYAVNAFKTAWPEFASRIEATP